MQLLYLVINWWVELVCLRRATTNICWRLELWTPALNYYRISPTSLVLVNSTELSNPNWPDSCLQESHLRRLIAIHAGTFLILFKPVYVHSAYILRHLTQKSSSFYLFLSLYLTCLLLSSAAFLSVSACSAWSRAFSLSSFSIIIFFLMASILTLVCGAHGTRRNWRRTMTDEGKRRKKWIKLKDLAGWKRQGEKERGREGRSEGMGAQTQQEIGEGPLYQGGHIAPPDLASSHLLALLHPALSSSYSPNRGINLIRQFILMFDVI